MFRSFERNHYGRDWVVGDIHGCFYMLDRLLDRAGFDRHCDRLFSLGDLIDRGPDSERALAYLDEPWFHAIRGNHEQMLLDSVRHGGDLQRLWQVNGGEWFAELSPWHQETFTAYCSALPLAAEVELHDGRRAGLAHADVPDDWADVVDGLTGDTVTPELANRLLWQRERATEIERRDRGLLWRRRRRPIVVHGIDLVLFGHTPMSAPTRCENTRWLDTGAFMGRRLTVAELALDGCVWSLASDLDHCSDQWRCVVSDRRR
ncbi:phosphoprotein phosphatase [Salinisphaera sp. T31B1]